MKRLELTRGNYAIVDDEDYPELSKYKWSDNGIGYAIRKIRFANGKTTSLLLSRFIMKAPPNMLVDHIDGNTFNNQKSNLRLCTRSENSCNQRLQNRKTSSRFKGVYWHKGSRRWHASIGIGGKAIFLGDFTKEVDAAHAYDEAALKYHKHFVRTETLSSTINQRDFSRSDS